MALKPGILVKDGKQMGYPQIGSSYTAGDYIEIDGNEISVNPVVPNENITYEFKTKDASGSDATITLIKKSGDTVISSTDYNYHSVMGNNYITVDDLFYFGYSTTFTASASSWGYKLLVASEDHAVDYTRIWTYDNVVDYTENFTNIDHSGECLVLKAQMDAALENKQDTLTFDSVPTDGSTNPVESNGVYDALATKQDATDNNLQTTAKTVVGGINELNSNLTSLEDWTDADAKTLTGNPITLTDAAAVDALSLSMDIEPVQDLHGFDHPWLGGAGKNKLHTTATTTTKDDVTYTVNSDGTISLSGTASGVAGLTITTDTVVDNTKTYILSGLEESSNIVWNNAVLLDNNQTQLKTYSLVGRNDITFDDFNQYPTAKYLQVGIKRYQNGVVSGIIKPMLRLSTETDATFAPYTNICPISGRTSGTVQTTDGTDTNTATITFGQTVYGGSVDFKTGVCRVSYVSKTFNENVVLTVGTSQSSGLRYADIVYSQNNMGAKTVADNYMICSSYAKIDASDTPTYGKFRVYSDSVAFLDEDFVDVASAKTKLNGVQLVYELATPTELSLTPAELELLKGQNTITANGATISLTYQPDNLVGEVMEQVQPQIDDIAEDVANKLDAPVLVVSSSSTGKHSDKLATLRTAFAALTDKKKQRAYILYGAAKYSVGNWNSGIFYNIYYDFSQGETRIVMIDLNNVDTKMARLVITSSSTTFESLADSEGQNAFMLYA